MATDFWANQRVLVTGGSGFLGQHIHQALSNIRPRVEQTIARSHDDLRNQESVSDIIETTDWRGLYDADWMQSTDTIPPTLVIHCAANVGGIGKNKAQPGAIMYDNLLMNTHVLHEAYAAGVQKFVGIGSVCAYPKNTPTPFREHNLFNGYPEETNAPYGITKRALLVMGQAYRQQYGFNAIHVMLANLYGPGDHFDLETGHVIPAIIRRMVEAKQRGDGHITLWGSGEATREFLYVEDAAQAILRAAEIYDSPEPINIGTGQSIRIRDLAKLIKEIVGYTGGILWDTSQPDGQPARELDIRRAALELEWAAETALGDGLQQTVDWYMREVAHA